VRWHESCLFFQTADHDAMTTPENSLTNEQITHFAQRIDARKALLLEEIRQVLDRSSGEHYVDLIGGSGDSADAATASLLRDITEAEIIRDVGEVRDIVQAEQRIAAGRYGLCTDCGTAIRYKRLDAYPTAKRCFACQVRREKLQAPSPYTGR
jgi:RNA polymerase-binding transcription factor DksA